MLRFVNQHYAPDVASTGQHLTDLAEYFAERGVEVEVLTARGHYVGGILDAPAREVRGGVTIRRFRTAGLGRRSRVGRVVDYALFYTRVAWLACFGDAPVATVYLTTPPLLGVVGLVGKILRGRRYGIWSMDLHPDAEIAAGMLRPHGFTARALGGLNDRAYRGADVVIDLGPYMRRRILAKGVSPEHLHTVPVWGPDERKPADGTADTAAPGLRDQWGLRGKFIIMYSGNAGIVHDFGGVLEAMHLCRDDPTIYFLFVGGGPRRSAIEAFAHEHNIQNFSYHDYVPRERLADALEMADAHLITLREEFAGISVPGKLYGIMSAARPALFVGPAACETADTIRDGQCGTIVDPAYGSTAARIVDVIRAWRDDPATARAAGARGLAAYLSRYQRGPNCDALAGVLRRTWPAVSESST